MDLTRLYNLTTPELRKEAERLGIEDTYAMSRGQLIQALRSVSSSTTKQSSGLLGKVFGFAKWAMHAAGETRGETEAETVAGSETAPGTVAASLSSEAGTAPEAGAEAGAETEAEIGAEIGAVSASEPVTVSVSVSETVSAAVLVSAADDADAAAGGTGASSRPPAGVFSNSGGLFDEPIPTRTMARILADQGHYKRSLAIYARLLDEEPRDGELLAEVEAVRAEARARRSHAPS
jgi:hypothetical protein